MKKYLVEISKTATQDGRIKSIEIMDGENVAIHYDINDSDNANEVVKTVGQLIQEYKTRHNQKEDR